MIRNIPAVHDQRSETFAKSLSRFKIERSSVKIHVIVFITVKILVLFLVKSKLVSFGKEVYRGSYYRFRRDFFLKLRTS